MRLLALIGILVQTSGCALPATGDCSNPYRPYDPPRRCTSLLQQ